MDAQHILRQTAKKVFKTGLFHSFVLKPGYLSFKDCFNNLYTVSTPDNVGFWFRIGRPYSYTVLKPTFESEYNALGLVNMCEFIDLVKPMHTDNPDYILRVSKHYLLNQHC